MRKNIIKLLPGEEGGENVKVEELVHKIYQDKFLRQIFTPGNSILLLLDHSIGKYKVLSNNLEQWMKIKEKDLSLKDFLELIHPEDLSYVEKCEKIAWYFFYDFIEKNQIPYYKVCYQFRMKDTTNLYKASLYQAMIVSTDSENKLSNVLISISDINHVSIINPYKVSFLDVRGKQSYTDIKTKSDLHKIFTMDKKITGREIQILKHLAEGYGSKEIASELNISYDTVRTHRNNILKKTKFKTLTHAVSHYTRQGII